MTLVPDATTLLAESQVGEYDFLTTLTTHLDISSHFRSFENLPEISKNLSRP